MVMDKGLGLHQVRDLIEIAHPYIDIVKLGFGTSILSANLERKLELYRNARIPCYFGGTLFEAFWIRGQLDDFLQLIDNFGLAYVEISDGCLEIDHKEKCACISKLAKRVTVLSEVGSKDAEVILPPYKWIELMRDELNAGAYKIIAEARESGNVGLFRASGEVRMGLVDEILTQIPSDKVIWEAPKKKQQEWFIKKIGPNVNLGNISYEEIIALEALRLGLRGDTFHEFLQLETV